MMRIAFLLMLLALWSCNRKNPSAAVADQDLRIQAMKKVEQDALVYNVRIFPGKAMMEGFPGYSQDMMYRADSCFYLSDGLQKIYPAGTDYIQGGVARSFEYLVTFELPKAGAEGDFTLVYQDRYMNKKKYQLLFN